MTSLWRLLALSVVILANFGDRLTATPIGNDEESAMDFPLTCEVRKYNFTAVQTDSNGKKCRGLVSTKACYGSCNTYEVGEVGQTESDQQVCLHRRSRERTVTLTKCDPGVAPETREFQFLEAVACACQQCNPAVVNCRSRTGKRKRTKTTLAPEGRFGAYHRRPQSNSNRKNRRRQQRRRNSIGNFFLV